MGVETVVAVKPKMISGLELFFTNSIMVVIIVTTLCSVSYGYFRDGKLVLLLFLGGILVGFKNIGRETPAKTEPG